MSDPNVFEPEWDALRDEAPFRWQRSLVGRRAGSRDLGASLFEVPPGAQTFPLHVHFHNEELLVVIAGAPTLRTAGGERQLAPGAVVAFPAGRDGGHALRNDTQEPARLLIVSTMRAPEINAYPDTGEIWVRDYPPGTDPPAGALDDRFRPDG